MVHRTPSGNKSKSSDQIFEKVLVANRGEIAVRVIKTLSRLGINSVAVYSEIEENQPHVLMADEAICLGPAPVAESYMNVGAVIGAARRAKVEAIHPGYGFFAENAEFAEAVAEAGFVFIGPSSDAISAMGSKINSRRIMADAGVSTVPGIYEQLNSLEEARRASDDIGFPVAVKASGAGGGKGFRVAQNTAELAAAFEGAREEGYRFFGDSTVYLERYLSDPRHIEVQIIADALDNVVHLYDRDCTIQRRHQKLVEEAPSPTISNELRQQICAQAVRAAEAINYVGAGTVEGLVEKNAKGEDEFYFLEMNTRIQVEHGITELVTGVDIVEQQLLAAAGFSLSVNQDDISIDGHAIEVRINAENAAKGFLPAGGTVSSYVEPCGDGIRIDSGIREGTVISPYYDSLLCKVLVHAPTRNEATSKMSEALDSFVIEGPKATLLPFHRALMASDEWKQSSTGRAITENPREFMASRMPTAGVTEG